MRHCRRRRAHPCEALASGAAPDPKIDEALGRLDPEMPLVCKKYVNAVCRRERTPEDYQYRVQACDAYVNAINSLVKQRSAEAVEICNSMWDWVQYPGRRR